MSEKELNKIAIQGIEGCFHHIAAQHFQSNGKAEVAPYNNFEDLVEDVAKGKYRYGIIAIENSLAGSILDNYRLLHKYPVKVCGEVYLRIRQNLLCLPGVTLSELKEVYSHPMALAQSSDFFRDYPYIKLIESADTAESAKMVMAKHKTTIGAVASVLAADYYNLQVLRENIESHHQNYTRFLIIHQPSKFEEHQKASVSLTLKHERGALLRMLSVAEKSGFNLTKIQSAPIQGEPWRYRFFVDLHKKEGISGTKLLRVFENCTETFEIIGIYQEGKHHEA